jgi:hypothetical protein
MPERHRAALQLKSWRPGLIAQLLVARAKLITRRWCTGTFFLRTSDRDAQSPAIKISAIEAANRFLRLGRCRHRYKGEASGLSSHSVLHQRGFANRAGLSEEVLQLDLCCVEGEIPDVQFVVHVLSCICGALCGLFPFIGFQIATVGLAANGHANRTTSNLPTPTWASNLRSSTRSRLASKATDMLAFGRRGVSSHFSRNAWNPQSAGIQTTHICNAGA